ncbi:MOSC domain-containing protein [Paenibacillus ginsengarvi]|uniref:MOSC domain-containing protein n=1 Tax=Paenibacillus ginsengarvi TaxID=400777 RepID=A0A3B0C817_9BACL|nr:MOSC domain-containing protein [Paenibacillus ginsengarvi]RKN82123.1 MOSC domain-containing protein [Paenibacillus ginsengarvi]
MRAKSTKRIGGTFGLNIDIVSLNVGKPQTYVFQGKEVPTGIFKNPAPEGPVPLSAYNFAGDGQADLVHHGGLDKAVCVYSYEHYPYWEKQLGRKLAYGAFGENLTVRGLTEDAVCIGDIYAIGEVRLQVTQPRQPCFKLAKKYDVPDLPLLVQQTGYTGFYFRVLTPGLFDRTRPMRLERRHPAGLTVEYANTIKHHDKENREGIEALLAVEELSGNWRASFIKRIAGNEPSSDERLKGSL